MSSRSRLSNEQVRLFAEEGYLIVNDVFDPADLDPLRRELADLIDRRIADLAAEGKLTDRHVDEPFERRLARIYHDSMDNGKAVANALEGSAGGGHCGIEMFRTITHPKLLACVESLVGPEIVGSSVYRIRPKIPGMPRGVVPWHQDSGYFSESCDRHLVLTCWIPLVDATGHNGCMQILPRVHRRGVFTHHTGGNGGLLVIRDQDLPSDPQRAVTAEVPAGGVVFMSNLTPHCSTPNQSDSIRWSIDLRYQSADVPNNVGLWPAEDDDSPRITMACYPPDADFVLQSRRDPHSVATYEDFVRRRMHFGSFQRPLGPLRPWQPLSHV